MNQTTKNQMDIFYVKLQHIHLILIFVYEVVQLQLANSRGEDFRIISVVF